MKRFLIATGVALIAGVAVAMMAAPYLVSTQLAKAKITERISAWAGTPVTLHDEPVMTLFPALSVEVEDVAVSGAGHGQGPPLITIPSLKASLRILPLLSGRIEVGALTLVRPNIHFVGDETGANNWTGGTRAGAMLDALSSRLAEGQFGEVVLHDGTITYEDRRSHGISEVEVTDFRFGWNDAAQTGEVSGTFTLCGSISRTEGSVDRPLRRVQGKSRCSGAAAQAVGARRSAADEVDFIAGGSLGESNLLATPFQRFVEWLGIPTTTTPFGPLHIVGKFEVDKTSMAVSEATFDFDGNAARGDFTVRPGNDRPMVRGSLVFDRLDLSPYLARLRPPFMSTAELLALPISADWLSLADADLRISVDELDVGMSHLSEAALNVVTRDGRMTLTLENADLANGRMEGRATVEPAKDGVAARLSVQLDEVSVGDAARFVWSAGANRLIRVDAPLRGKGMATVNLSSEGATIGKILRSLSGWGTASIQDGAVVGVDLEATLDGLVDGNTIIARGRAPFLPRIGRTPFHVLETYVTIDTGVVHARRFLLSADRFEVTLAGEGNLERGEIEATGNVVLLTTTLGEEGGRLRPLVELPFGVGGTLRDPVVAPGIPRIEHREEDAASLPTGIWLRLARNIHGR